MKSLSPGQRWQDVPSAYLGISFGVAPLLGTVYDSLEVLQEKTSASLLRQLHFDVRGRHSASYYNASGFYPNIPITETWECDTRKRVACYVWLDLAKFTGFTTGNPLEGGWELVPFSWVVDQIIPIGQYLTSLDAYQKTKSISGSVTTLKRARGRAWTETSKTWTQGSYTFGFRPMRDAKYEYDSYQRVVFSKPPSLRMPRYRPSSSLRHLSYDLALLIGLRSSGR